MIVNNNPNFVKKDKKAWSNEDFNKLFSGKK